MYLFLQPQHIVVTPRLSERFFFYILSSVLPIYLDASAWLYADFLKLPSVVVCYKSNTFKSDISLRSLCDGIRNVALLAGLLLDLKLPSV
jgi:hypothetical protein